jgi:TM2 domain-containing membrane protein YozV
MISNSKPGSRPAQPVYSLAAGILSYLVPGLGQISQGRVGKGILFFICLYGMFFYGMYLGSWKNVYLPDAGRFEKVQHPSNAFANLKTSIQNVAVNVYNRLQFAGQVWIGVAAWPALWQYNRLPVPPAETSPFWHNFQRTPPERREDAPLDWDGKTLNELQADGDKTWDLGWVYTVIAGVLNVLVIYDAAAGPAFAGSGQAPRRVSGEAAPA